MGKGIIEERPSLVSPLILSPFPTVSSLVHRVSKRWESGEERDKEREREWGHSFPLMFIAFPWLRLAVEWMTRGMNGKETGREIMAQPSSLPPSLIGWVSLSYLSLISRTQFERDRRVRRRDEWKGRKEMMNGDSFSFVTPLPSSQWMG